MKLRPFTKNDWMGYSGAVAPYKGQEPMIGEEEFGDGGGALVIADKHGIEVTLFPPGYTEHFSGEEGFRLDMDFGTATEMIENWKRIPPRDVLHVMGFINI